MNRTSKISIGLCLGIAALLVFTTMVFALNKDYYGLTTVYYNNGINDYGSSWNANYSDFTSPARSMDQFGLNVWTAYVSCNYTVQGSTYVHYEMPGDSWLMRYNQSSIADGMAMSKVTCSGGQTRRLHNYIQHWWQDSGYPGDGGTINQVVPG